MLKDCRKSFLFLLKGDCVMNVNINIEGATIEVIEGLIEASKAGNETILNRDIDDDFDLKAVIGRGCKSLSYEGG